MVVLFEPELYIVGVNLELYIIMYNITGVSLDLYNKVYNIIDLNLDLYIKSAWAWTCIKKSVDV